MPLRMRIRYICLECGKKHRKQLEKCKSCGGELLRKEDEYGGFIDDLIVKRRFHAVWTAVYIFLLLLYTAAIILPENEFGRRVITTMMVALIASAVIHVVFTLLDRKAGSRNIFWQIPQWIWHLYLIPGALILIIDRLYLFDWTPEWIKAALMGWIIFTGQYSWCIHAPLLVVAVTISLLKKWKIAWKWITLHFVQVIFLIIFNVMFVTALNDCGAGFDSYKKRPRGEPPSTWEGFPK